MRRPSLLRVSTSDSEGPSQKQIWLFRLAKFLLVLTFVEDGLRMIIHPEGQARVALGLPSVGPSRAAGEADDLVGFQRVRQGRRFRRVEGEPGAEGRSLQLVDHLRALAFVGPVA